MFQSRYEEEKKALLASLRGQDKRFSSERQRQLELAKLRREQKKIAKEDKFDAAALVLGIAKQQEAARDARYDVMLVFAQMTLYCSPYTRKNAQVVTNLQQTCRGAVPTTCQQDVFALLVPSLLTSC